MTVVTHKISKTYSTDAGVVKSTQDVYTSQSELSIEMAIPTALNQEFDVAFPIGARLISYMISCDQAVTLRTNANDGTGGNVIAVGQNVMIMRGNLDIQAALFTIAVARLFVQNASGVTANFKMRVLFQSEP